MKGRKRKQVTLVNLKMGETTNFDSFADAARAIGTHPSIIRRIVNGEVKVTKGCYTAVEFGAPIPDLKKVIEEGKRGRPKKKEPEQKLKKTYRYYFTKERGEYEEKVARWNPKNHVLRINYNFKVKMIDNDVCPNLDYMQDIVRGKMKVRRKKFIYVLDGCASKKEKGIYFINAQMYIICDVFPSVEQLRQYERWITDVRYYDDEGNNDFNERRLLRKRKLIDERKMTRNHAVIIKNLETEEEIRYNSVKEAAEEFEVSSKSICTWCQEKKKKNGFQWRYAY